MNAYRKLQKRMGALPATAPYEEEEVAEAPAAEGAASEPAEPAPRDKPRPASGKKGKFNALEALAQRRAPRRDEAAAARRRTAEAMRKRNARGQPVMRYRVDAILAKLQAESKAAR